MIAIQPTLHKPIPMGAKVRVPDNYLGRPATGEVVGIASMHVIFIYIVLLDVPYEDKDYGTFRAITVQGSELSDLNGGNWKLEA